MNGYFDEIERITENGKKAIENGDAKMVGEMMDGNHDLLNSIGVSYEKLDKLMDITGMLEPLVLNSQEVVVEETW